MISVDDTNIECLEEFNLFVPLQKPALPKLILGFQIKNQYDFQRLHIQETLNPLRYRHLGKTLDNLNEWICFYGLDIEMNKKVREVYHSITSICKDVDSNTYNDVLNIHGLSCDDNYAYLRRNIFPIDVKHTTSLCNDKKLHDYQRLRDILILPVDYPWFANWNEFTLYLLT